MSKLEKKNQEEASKLSTLRKRQAELQAKAKEAANALSAAKETFGRKLAAGDDAVDQLSD